MYGCCFNVHDASCLTLRCRVMRSGSSWRLDGDRLITARCIVCRFWRTCFFTKAFIFPYNLFICMYIQPSINQLRLKNGTFGKMAGSLCDSPPILTRDYISLVVHLHVCNYACIWYLGQPKPVIADTYLRQKHIYMFLIF